MGERAGDILLGEPLGIAQCPVLDAAVAVVNESAEVAAEIPETWAVSATTAETAGPSVLAASGETADSETGEPLVEERRTAEHWTFERTLGAADPNWVLAGTAG